MKFDRSFLLCALLYAAVGMALGAYMGASHNHSQLVAHAHLLLLGFVVSFAYATIHRLWLAAPNPLLAKLQFFLHHAAVIGMFSGLLLLYGGVVPDEKIGPLLGLASIGALVALLLMLFMVLRSPKA